MCAASPGTKVLPSHRDRKVRESPSTVRGRPGVASSRSALSTCCGCQSTAHVTGFQGHRVEAMGPEPPPLWQEPRHV